MCVLSKAVGAAAHTSFDTTHIHLIKMRNPPILVGLDVLTSSAVVNPPYFGLMPRVRISYGQIHRP